MNWYVVDKKYIQYLIQFNSRVGYVEYGEKLKLHVGILLSVNGCRYYVPIASAKPKHQQTRWQKGWLKTISVRPNAILHRLPGMGIKTSTLNKHIECHDRRAGEILQQKAQQTLQQYSISSQTGRIENPDLIPDCVKYPDRPAEEVQGQCAETQIRNTLNRKLWAGNADDAVTYLKNLDPEFIKNPLRLEDAVNYLERKKPYVPCYALRSVMDYLNSSNPVEKVNDLTVAGRQKHNGMSWSYTGSSSLAILSALLYNGELNSWLARAC